MIPVHSNTYKANDFSFGSPVVLIKGVGGSDSLKLVNFMYTITRIRRSATVEALQPVQCESVHILVRKLLRELHRLPVALQ